MTDEDKAPTLLPDVKNALRFLGDLEALTRGASRSRLVLDKLLDTRQGPAIGQWLEFPGYQLAKTVSQLGEDWVLIVCEHGAIDDREMHLQIAALSSSSSSSSSSCSPIVRIPASEPWMMKRALDADTHGIMVPMCETPQQAASIVAECKYPPLGNRGAGARFAHNSFNQSPRFEARVAVDNCEAIAAVDGVDMLFVGPNDLASPMGYVAFDHGVVEELQGAIGRVLRAAKGEGKYAGHFAMGAEEARRRWVQRFDFVSCGTDIVGLSGWMGGMLGGGGGMKRLRELVEETTTTIT
ncbi:Pyruvate/Phosphoenolpyruvate kinase-like domain-containing protein [Aspergillus cavernicola]|uniref:Pyruvate/Phosphoenolpyruvate kinase-like domain-containing protein n=1 Tax=Aspergillus cavernicola TaxID=176166 RepID=A0ABR4IMH9_9EURO